ncbi:Rieske 2Fe-2S domain-containing protein [Alcanivorax sp. 1008]|uniref:Rieske (2Fe-2S) protein n=1 Tax=Alcanivorax sp. 1008 TaxID=2816853 RepID=UPI001D732931|nr:Rieske 2Fe-2S domain-containing protein [Alcanivorax sp. 1008]MCC1496413.1 Rieske 2Fe-2S domain-containing protein [Alcanivorax sp. 1008]
MAFHRLVRLDQLYDGFRQSFRIEREDVLLLQRDGRVFLIEGRCPHQGFSLAQGSLHGERIICPRHGFAFHIEHGDCFQAPSCRLKTWLPAYDGNYLGVEI